MPEEENQRSQQDVTGHPGSDANDAPEQKNKKTIFQYLTVALLTLFTCFLLYGHRWLVGETIFRGAVQEQYYLLGQYAFDRLIVDGLSGAYGERLFPLWNHLNALGTPLLGNMLSGVFYPLKAFTYLFPGDAARDLYIVARLVIAALLTLALCRKLRLSSPAGVLASLAFAFTGYMKMFVNENYINADILLPGLILFTLRIRERKKLVDVAALALLAFAVINNGHPEAAFYTLLPPALVAVAAGGVLSKGTARTALLFALAMAIAFLASLPMLLPFIEYWERGYHFHVPGAGMFHYGARQITSLVTPWFFGQAPAGAPFLWAPRIAWVEGGAATPSYLATTVPWLAPSLGSVPILFMLIAASRLKKLARLDVVLLAYVVFFLGVMFGLPLFKLVGRLPVFSFSGNFKHPEPGVALCVAILAGRGLDMVLTGRASRARVANILAVMVVAALFLGLAADPLPGGPGYVNKFSVLALLVLIVPGAWVAAFAGTGAKGLARTAAVVIVVGSAIACLTLDGYQQPMRDPGYESRIKAGTALDRLDEIAPLSRVYISQDVAPPNLNIIFGLADLRVMDGVNDRRLVRAINAINGHDRSEGGDYWYREVGYLQPMPDKLGHPMLNLFNVGYALTDGPLPYNRSIAHATGEGDVVAPGPGYVGAAKLPFDPAPAPGLLTHPPSMLAWRPRIEAKEIAVRFRPAATEDAVANQPDGAWLALTVDGALAYARHLHPHAAAADAEVPVMEVIHERADEDPPLLVFQSLPVASRDFDQVGWSDLRVEPAGAADDGDWVSVVQDSPRLYHNPRALPRVFLVQEALFLPEDNALKVLANNEIHPRTIVTISGREPVAGEATLSQGSGPPGMISRVEHGPQRLTARANLERSEWLVVSDLCYPGWKAYVNGKEIRIDRADYLLRAIRLGPGESLVKMVYVPASFRIGLWLLIVGVSALPATLVYNKYSKTARLG